MDAADYLSLSELRMIAVAVPKQTIAYCARWAPKQLKYKQKTPREPRTSATPCKTMRDR